MTEFPTSPLGFDADDSPRTSYTLKVNGVARPVADAWIGESLLYVLRERLGLAGAKGGCEQGECGACSVQVDGQLTAACLVPAALAEGVEIRTVEGLADEGVPSDVQQALAESGAVQCGYCAPGLAMAVHDLLERNHHPSELEARQALCGNLCRCTGYRGALAAVQAVATARAEEEESPEKGVVETPYFGDGPVDALIEATSPVEELVPMAGPDGPGVPVAPVVPAQAEHVDGYAEDDGYQDGYDDGYEAEAELPVYVDVPPQHGGYETYEGHEGYETPGYGTQEPGYPQQESYPQQGYATGTYDQPYEQPYEQSHGEGPYPGGPFGGRFPSQHDAPSSDSAPGEGVGTLLITEPAGTQQLPVVDPASGEYHPPAEYPTGQFHTGEFHTGEFATGEFHTGEFHTGEFATGEFHSGEFHTGEFHTGEFATGEYPTGEFPTGQFATGEIPVVGEYVGEYAAEGYAAADYSGVEYPQQDYPGADYATGTTTPTVPEQGGQAGQVEQTGELRLGSGLGSGLGAGMRAQAAARRLAGGDGSDAATTATTGSAPTATPAAAPVSFNGAATSAAGLPTDVTGSFHVGTLSAHGADPHAASPHGTHLPTDLPYDGATGVPGGLDPATGVYVLPHQHGQETGS